jgi:hypothetical protein
MELALSTEFGARMEYLLKELVTKTNQESFSQLKCELDDQIGPLELRLRRLESECQRMEQYRSMVMQLLTQMTDAMKAIQTTPDSTAPVVTIPVPATVVPQPPVVVSSPPNPAPVTTMSDVQRFLMQRLPNDRA